MLAPVAAKRDGSSGVAGERGIEGEGLELMLLVGEGGVAEVGSGVVEGLTVVREVAGERWREVSAPTAPGGSLERLRHCPNWPGAQSWQGLPAFTQAQLRQMPARLQRQHTIS